MGKLFKFDNNILYIALNYLFLCIIYYSNFKVIILLQETVRYEAEGHGKNARLCCRLISDSIFWLFYFTPTLTGWCNALFKKVPQRIIQKKRQQQIRDEDVSFILSFIYWVQQPFHV